MCFVVGSLDVCGAYVRIDLSGDKAFVSEEFLDAPDIGPTVEQVGSKAVAEGVGAGSCVESKFLDVFLEHSGDAARGQSSTEFVAEGGWFFGAVGSRASHLKVLEESFFSVGAQLTDTFFASFSANPNGAVGEINVAVIHSDQFAHA